MHSQERRQLTSLFVLYPTVSVDKCLEQIPFVPFAPLQVFQPGPQSPATFLLCAFS